MAAESGAEDVWEGDGDTAFIYTKPGDLAKVRDGLLSLGLTIENAELIRKPRMPMVTSDETVVEKILQFSEKLMELDEV